MKLLSDLFDLLVVRFFDFSFANCFLDFIFFSPTPNETGFLIKMIRFLICCWAVFYKLLSEYLWKLLLLIASTVSISVSSDGADSMSLMKHWSCCIFNWSFDVSFSFSFLFVCSFLGFSVYHFMFIVFFGFLLFLFFFLWKILWLLIFFNYPVLWTILLPFGAQPCL